VFLSPSPKPLIIPEDNFNDRLSSLETTASTVVAAMNNLTQRLFTSNSNRDQNTADKSNNINNEGQDTSLINVSLVSNEKFSLTHQNNLLNISSHNVQGLSTTLKQQQLNAFLTSNKIDIMGLSETKLSKNNAQYLLDKYNNTEYSSWWDAEGTQLASGVGLIIRTQLTKHVRLVKSYKGRIIYVDFYFKGKNKLRVIQFYNYADSNHKCENLELYNKIHEIIKEAIKFKFHIVIMGDFNLKPDDIITNAPKSCKKKNIPLWRRKIFTILNKYLFQDTAAYLSNHPEYTWFNKTSSSRIDHIWISRNLLPDLINFEATDPSFYTSDHRCITAILSTVTIFEGIQSALA